MNLLLQWLVATLTVLLTAYFVPGFVIAGLGAALVASAVIGLANLLIRPFLLFITLPINILTLGLFTWVVNAATLRLAAFFTPGFFIGGWMPALIGAFLVSLFSTLIYAVVRPNAGRR
ncbi:MAG: phage holin family protein [Bdellovibrionota bacterium]